MIRHRAKWFLAALLWLALWPAPVHKGAGRYMTEAFYFALRTKAAAVKAKRKQTACLPTFPHHEDIKLF